MTQASAVTQLSKIVESGRRAMGFTEHTAAGFTEPHLVTPKPAVSSGSLDIRSLFVMPAASDTAQVITYGSTPIVPFGSKSIALDAVIIANCRAASLGASVIVAAERNTAYTAAGPALYHEAGLFRVVEPAPFGLVADGTSADASATPWHDVPIIWGDAPSVAFRTVFSRRAQKDVGGGLLLEENLLQSIVAGLARAADATLLAAIVAANPPAFTLAAAAARGLRFGDLGALVGTDGQGAAVAADGSLRALGVPAELTDTVAQTIIGAFRKSAVAIHPEIQVHFERLNVNGDMGAVIFANMLPLVPDASAFWTGAAA